MLLSIIFYRFSLPLLYFDSGSIMLQANLVAVS